MHQGGFEALEHYCSSLDEGEISAIFIIFKFAIS